MTNTPATEPVLAGRLVGQKSYELKDHLGNVRAVVSDRKTASGEVEVLTASNYYPFGMLQPGNSVSSGDYRFGFQGQEMDNEIKGTGNSIDYKYRVHDVRIGRFLSIDPLTKDYPHYSPYSFSGNRVIDAFEMEGLEPFSMHRAITSNREYEKRIAESGTPAEKEQLRKTQRTAAFISGAMFFGPVLGVVAAPEVVMLSQASWSTLSVGAPTSYMLVTKFASGTAQDMGEQFFVQSVNNGGNYKVAFENIDLFNSFIAGVAKSSGIPKPIAEALKTMVSYENGVFDVNDDFTDILSEYGIRMSIGSLKPEGMNKGFEALFNIGNKGTRSQITQPFSDTLDETFSKPLIESKQDDYKVKVDNTSVDLKTK